MSKRNWSIQHLEKNDFFDNVPLATSYNEKANVSEAFASVFLENLEEMFSSYYLHSGFGITVHERVHVVFELAWV